MLPEALATGYAPSLYALNERLKALGDMPVVSIGFSSGGVHALRMAEFDSVKSVLLINGYTFTRRAVDSLENVNQLALEHMWMTANIPDKDADPSWVLRDRPDLKLRYVMGENGDLEHANFSRIKDFPNCSAHVIPGYADHNCLVPILENGDFHRLVDEAIENALSS